MLYKWYKVKNKEEFLLLDPKNYYFVKKTEYYVYEKERKEWVKKESRKGNLICLFYGVAVYGYI